MTSTSRVVVVKCTFCDTPYNYDFTTDPRMWCNKCNKQFRFKRQLSTSQSNQKQKIIEKSRSFIPPKSNDTQMSTGDIVRSVNDPVGFVTGIITEELMKTRDVRWATLFVSVLRESKKLDYNTQQEIEWSDQAKNLSIEELVEKVAIKGSISRSTSRRLDNLEDTSQLDNFLDV